MRKMILMLAMMLPMVFVSCSDNKDSDFNTREVSAFELESGTGTWESCYNPGYFIGFHEGQITYTDLYDESSGVHFANYSIDGNNLVIIDRNRDTFTLEISMMEYDGKEELAISGTGEAPYEFQKGSFEKSMLFSFFD